MQFRSVFDIIGPVMIGPSSSHTAGAARIGLVARQLFETEPEWAAFHLYGSFAKTYEGHGTDVALVGGILGFDTFDDRMTTSFHHADKRGLRYTFIEEKAQPEHPNTVRIRLGKGEDVLELVGISIGGGKVEIKELNGFALRLSGNHPAILVMHDDRYGAIANVATRLAKNEINIGHMEVSRKEQGKEALMVIEVDENIDSETMHDLTMLEHVRRVTKIHD
ncbi:L-serine ammonia-lyase, iron-sulfur-dependent subunit beta [Salisediminibacterium halotolerans]|uniref:L-serine deaminase n=1 Tax=Salisediminibacterium halotolerans TaxID=517425 RepID=A0A1H9Q0G0_9BACI|nr:MULTISPECIES: L-serine ammonia-lyase, iron-sulfur-dependent subunit beta [Salisediminibacterium]RLJ74264.1 L-serine dehydratase [Actinophytocola xinjiangensis]RPE87644.1 L-serine dehydratase [Salisediminibacterium halotolerans]TWG35101.1 L-serine dehydratase [Salisediminibacterium halotolerans]SER53363.1 L-serine dehydratase [Salisediminibacterium haloalkalitolerans]GEL06851.1 putative L-serine dehydratase, beta chain [Salisediminibacterium halotolerans]